MVIYHFLINIGKGNMLAVFKNRARELSRPWFQWEVIFAEGRKKFGPPLGTPDPHNCSIIVWNMF
jgi:hypothetical protein